MPMYYPYLESVQQIAEQMARNVKGKEYKGIIPRNEDELPLARKELGQYMRTVWNDEIAAIEIEYAVTKENYDEKLKESLLKKILGF